MELIINGEAYQFKFGIGFMREINKKIVIPVEGAAGVKREAGLAYYVARVIDGDVEALIDILYIANKGMTPRLTMEILDGYVDDDDTDIDELFGTVLDFLSKSNATKKVTLNLLEATTEAEQ